MLFFKKQNPPWPIMTTGEAHFNIAVANNYLVTVPFGKLAATLLSIEATIPGAKSFEIILASGFNKNGAGLLSGYGSMDITVIPPLMSVGNVSPAGALFKKSSPGKGGPGFVPLYGAASSSSSKAKKVPVDTGWPLMTTQPSYFHPVDSLGNFNPAPGPFPWLLSKNHMPLYFSDSLPVPVGVAIIYLPSIFWKSPPTVLVPKEAVFPENWPAKIFVAAGVGSVSGTGSMDSTNVVAFSKSDALTSKEVLDRLPFPSTVNVPVDIGEASFVIIQPSYAKLGPRSSNPLMLRARLAVVSILSSSSQLVKMNNPTANNDKINFFILRLNFKLYFKVTGQRLPNDHNELTILYRAVYASVFVLSIRGSIIYDWPMMGKCHGKDKKVMTLWGICNQIVILM